MNGRDPFAAVRALARVELRALRAHPRRALLLVVLVAVPVAAVAGAGTMLGVLTPSREERRTQAMGRADLVIEAPAGHADLLRATPHLPPDVRVARIAQGAESVVAGGLRLHARLVAAEAATLAPGAPVEGLVVLRAGRAPVDAGEVALSPSLLEGLGVDLGDRVSLAYGGPRVVTGVVVEPEAIDAPLVLRTPSLVEAKGTERLLITVGDPGRAKRLAGRLRDAGLRTSERAAIVSTDDAVAAIVLALGSIGFAEAGLVIAAALGVTLRRRRREIGLLGACGAPPAAVAAAIVISTALLALCAGVAGAVLGNAIAWGLHPFYDAWTGRLNGPFVLSPGHAIAGVGLGVVAAAVAAALPAIAAARVPIRDALGGRRPGASTPRATPAFALGALALGLGLGFAPPLRALVGAGPSVIGGALLVVAGLGLAVPWLLETGARLASAVPLVPRLALRDAGRFRARNAPVVAAILAGMATSVTIAALIASARGALDAFPAIYRDDQLVFEGAAAEEAARTLAATSSHVLAVAPYRVAATNGMPVVARLDSTGAARQRGHREPWVAVGDDTLLTVLGADAARADFAQGRLLALDPPDGTRSVRFQDGPRGAELATHDVVSVATGRRVAGPAYVLGLAAAERSGHEAAPPPGRGLVPWYVRLDAPVTARDLAVARALAEKRPGTSVDAALAQDEPVRRIHGIVLLLCLATGLVVLLVAAALSNAESEGDLHTLRTVGAPPAVLRGYRAARTGFLALLGSALAVPAGLVPAVRILADANVDVPFVLPWREILAGLVLLPLVASGLAWLLAGDGGRRVTRALT